MNHIICVCGNIGSGKSTLLQAIARTLPIVPEPIQQWGNWLDNFYSDPKKYAFGLQMRILLTFLTQHTTEHQWTVFERCPAESVFVFASHLLQEQILSNDEFQLLQQVYQQFAWKPRLYIYIRTDPDVCISRIITRQRPCEASLREQYVHQLHGQYEHFMDSIPPQQLITLDGNQPQHMVLKQLEPFLQQFLVTSAL